MSMTCILSYKYKCEWSNFCASTQSFRVR